VSADLPTCPHGEPTYNSCEHCADEAAGVLRVRPPDVTEPEPVILAELAAARDRLDEAIDAVRNGTGDYPSFRAALSDLNALFERASPDLWEELRDGADDALDIAREITRRARQEHER
jgi:hypothetical protein